MFSRVFATAITTVTSYFSGSAKKNANVVYVAPPANQPAVPVQQTNPGNPNQPSKKKKKSRPLTYYKKAEQTATLPPVADIKKRASEIKSESPSPQPLPWLAIREAEKKEKIKNALERDKLKAQNAEERKARKAKKRETELKLRPARTQKESGLEEIAEEVLDKEAIAEEISEKEEIKKEIKEEIPDKEEKENPEEKYFEINPDEITVAKAFPAGIGTGRHAKVFQGFWRDTPVALKFFAADAKQSDYEFCLKQFLNEVDQAKGIEVLGLSSAVKFFGSVSIPSSQYHCLAMEHLSKGNLWHWLDRYVIRSEHPPRPELFRLLRNVAAGLALWHKAGKIHGDLKLQNIMLLEDLQIKLIDVEFVKTLQAGQTRVKAATSAGTAAYMAPEIIRSGEYSLASDIFAFGSLIYSLGCLGLPFSHKRLDDGEITNLIARGYIHAYHREHYLTHWQCPAELIPLIYKCWDPVPKLRPTVQDLFNTFDLLVKQEEKIQFQFRPSIK